MRPCKESKIIAGLCVADLVSTIVLVRSQGATEANMVMRFYLQYGMLAFIGAKCMLFVPALMIAEWYRHHNPRLITGTLRLVILLYVGLYSVGVFQLNVPGGGSRRHLPDFRDRPVSVSAEPPMDFPLIPTSTH
jgi:hypothetical protein